MLRNIGEKLKQTASFDEKASFSLETVFSSRLPSNVCWNIHVGFSGAGDLPSRTGRTGAVRTIAGWPASELQRKEEVA